MQIINKNQDIVNEEEGAIEGQLVQHEINLKIQQQTDDKIKKPIDSNLQFSFFMFVNPTSGGNKAGELIKLETEKITFNLDNPKEKNPKNKYLIDVYFVDLLNLESKTKGMNTLKAL